MLVIKIDQRAIRKQRKAQRLAMLSDCLGFAALVVLWLALYMILPN